MLGCKHLDLLSLLLGQAVNVLHHWGFLTSSSRGWSFHLVALRALLGCCCYRFPSCCCFRLLILLLENHHVQNEVLDLVLLRRIRLVEVLRCYMMTLDLLVQVCYAGLLFLVLLVKKLHLLKEAFLPLLLGRA